MYLDFYHLKKKPFHVTPNPEFLYLSPTHREALASIVYGVEQRKGIIEVTGEVGTGKTTILRSYLGQTDPERLKAAYVFNPNVSFPALLKNFFQELGLTPKSGEAHEMIEQFYLFLIDEYKKDNTVVLVVDEAQNMPVETLENLRLLSNLETATDKLLQIVLCGQPELENHLGRKELRQLSQRIVVRAHLSSLSRKESLEYIRHRLSTACCETDIFTPAALARIVDKAKGIPRVINILCDNALITGYGYQEKNVSSRTAMEVIADLERKPSLKYREWRIAVLSFLLLLTAGYWIYNTTAFTFQSPKTTKFANPAPPPQLLNSSFVGRVESPVPPVAGQRIMSDGTNGLQEEKKPISEGVKQKGKPVRRVVRKGDNLSRLAENIYGFSDQGVLSRVRQKNRHIKDQNVILPGESIVFPALEE